MAITFEKRECREIYDAADRWGLAYYINNGWSVYRADRNGFTFVGRLSQLGEETVKELIK